MVEGEILCGHREGQVGRTARAGVVGQSVADADLRLERRVAAEQRRVVERDAVVEHAAAGAQDRLVVDRVGHAEARLDGVEVGLGEAFRLIAEERQDRRIAATRLVPSPSNPLPGRTIPL